MATLWGFVIIAGPLLLLLALVAGRFLNKNSRVSRAETEAATKRVRDEQAAEDAAREPR
ncbi:hypothetical protein ACT009_10335 [Sphingomonas sp. Tas61C01]|uniref:hypothetical protein n=1 Tax=Sphingomonas sp. Tas61C01 TaxID=3458297 RepID=UPI00403E364C